MSPQVSTGIQVEGEPAGGSLDSDAGFNAALAEQAAKGQRSAPEHRNAALDPGHDRALEIRRAISTEPVSTNVEDGIVEADPERAANRQELDSLLTEIGEEPWGSAPPKPKPDERVARLEQRAQAAEFDAAWLQFEQALLDGAAAEDFDLAHTLYDLKQVGGDEAVDMALHLLEDEGYGSADEGDFDDVFDRLRTVEVQEEARDLAQREILREAWDETKRAQREAEDFTAKRAYLNRWAADRGLPAAEANARIAAAEAIAHHELGVDLPNLPMGEWEHVFHAAEAYVEDARKRNVEDRFHRQMLAGDTSILAGLTEGGRPVMDRTLPPSRPNVERIVLRATARPDARGAEVRAALAAPDQIADDLRAALAKIERDGAKARAREVARG